MLYVLFYHKHLGLGNVSLAFVKQDYFGEQSYKSCLKKRKSAVRDTPGDRKKIKQQSYFTMREFSCNPTVDLKPELN